MDAIFEPLQIFSDAAPQAANQRSDILLRNPRDFGRQVILDVAVIAVDLVYFKFLFKINWLSKTDLLALRLAFG